MARVAGWLLSPEELTSEADRVTVRRAEDAIRRAAENNQRVAAMLASREVVERRQQQQRPDAQQHGGPR